MSAAPTWLYSFVYLAGGSLIAGVQIAGLVVALRRWHLGMAARLGAIGFGLLLCSTAGQQVFSLLGRFVIGASPAGNIDSFLRAQMVVMSAGVLLTAAGYVTLLLALRTALIDSERSRSAMPDQAAGESPFADQTR